MWEVFPCVETEDFPRNILQAGTAAVFQPGKIIYLKDGEQSIDYGVEIRGGSALGEVELSTEELHSEQGEDEDEQKEE